jgi:cell division protein FtsW (lipid II flippase)
MRRLWEQLGIATNWPVLVAVFVLCALGLMSIRADDVDDGNKQLLFMGVGVAGMALFQAVNYQKIGRLAWGFYVLSLMLLVYTIVPFTHGDGILRVPYRNGAYNWINLGPASLQPAELTKIAFVLVLARYLRFRQNYRTLAGLAAPFALAVVPLILILKQPDLGTALVFIPTLLVMLFVAGAKAKHLWITIAAGVLLMPVAWFSGPDSNVPVLKHFPALIKEYQRNRIKGLFSDDPSLANINY